LRERGRYEWKKVGKTARISSTRVNGKISSERKEQREDKSSNLRCKKPRDSSLKKGERASRLLPFITR
jgi:hypothetical protein